MSEIQWANELHDILNSSDTDDEDIVDLIENDVPEDEGRVFDYKTELYISAADEEVDNERKGKLVKLFNALSNVRADSPYRYVFVGFDEDGFQGVNRLGAEGGDHILDIDNAEIQNLINDYLEPSPDIKRYKITVSGSEGCILEVEREENRPVLIDQSVRISDGKETVVYEGQAYTRKGSRNTLMTNSEYRELIERRKQVMSEILENFAADLSRVVSLPTEQLEELDLNVSSSEEGVPVKEIVTTDAASGVDEKLRTSVKNWNSTGGRRDEGELISSRTTIYEFYEKRDELDLTDETAEFLFRSCLENHQVGSEWLMRYDQDVRPLFEEIIEENRSAATIKTLEKVLLTLGEKNLLEKIEDIGYWGSDADEYVKQADKDSRRRVQTYTGYKLQYGRERVRGFFEDEKDADTKLDNVIIRLLDRESGALRTTLREIEMIRLALEAE